MVTGSTNILEYLHLLASRVLLSVSAALRVDSQTALRLHVNVILFCFLMLLLSCNLTVYVLFHYIHIFNIRRGTR